MGSGDGRSMVSCRRFGGAAHLPAAAICLLSREVTAAKASRFSGALKCWPWNGDRICSAQGQWMRRKKVGDRRPPLNRHPWLLPWNAWMITEEIGTAKWLSA
ncbi:unnamed protein product [Urochloa humidicola]